MSTSVGTETITDVFPVDNKRESVETWFKSHPETIDEFLTDETAFYAKYGKKEEKKDPPPADGHKPEEKTETPPAPAASPDEELVLTGYKIKKADLGTYAKTEDPIREVIKGKNEADIAIRFLKEEKIPKLTAKLDEQMLLNQGLKRELDEWKAKQAAAPAKPKMEFKEIKVPEPKTDAETLDTEYQKSMAKAQKELAEQNKQLYEYIKSLEDEASIIKNGVQTAQAKIEEHRKEETTKESLSDELDEIDGVRKLFSGKGLNYKRPYAEIENEYLDFVDGLASAAGVKEIRVPVKDKAGNVIGDKYSDELEKAFALYKDEAKGKELREKCGSKLPEDFNDLLAVNEIRGIRNQYKDASGVPMEYERAVQIYLGSRLQDIKLQERIAGAQAAQVAAKRVEDFPKEAPTDKGAIPINLKEWTQDRFASLIQKKVKTDADKELIRNIGKSVPGISDKEINEWINIGAEP